MSEIDNDQRQDKPINDPNEDFLDRRSFVDSLSRALVYEVHNNKGEVIYRRSTGFVIGLTGPWGAGKSSILRLLKIQLTGMEHVLAISLNPWLFKNRDELVAAYFNSLKAALGKNKNDKIKEVAKAFGRYRTSINATGKVAGLAIDASGGHGIGGKIANFVSWISEKISNFGETFSPDQERLSLEKKLVEAKTAVVVLIDELDRVEDSEVRAVAQLIKAIGDIQGISYLVAYDPKRVAEALGNGHGDERLKSGELYLEKIIQHAIPIRPLFIEDNKSLTEKMFKANGLELMKPTEKSQIQLWDYLLNAITTPREVKRLIGTYAVIERAVRGEICPYDILGYSWLLTKSPNLREKISIDLDKVVDDPSEKEMMKRAVAEVNKKLFDTPTTIFGKDGENNQDILTLLFPRFDSKRTKDERYNRISLRRNLIRLLYLGNPPGMMPRQETIEIFSLSRDALSKKLIQLQKDAMLVPFFDKLDDILHEVHEQGSDDFWVTVSQYLMRQTDWVKEGESQHRLGDEIAAMLLRLGMKGGVYAASMKMILDKLRVSGDLILAPWILRKHLFAHGMTKYQNGREPLVLSKQETEILLQQEIPRYREAVISGLFLRRVTSSELLYVLSNTNLWDANLRLNFTNQIRGFDAIKTLAAILVPAGSTTDKSNLEELFDTQKVEKEIDINVFALGWPHDQNVRASLEHLKIILSGKAA